jgi:hypothetical protein
MNDQTDRRARAGGFLKPKRASLIPSTNKECSQSTQVVVNQSISAATDSPNLLHEVDFAGFRSCHGDL